MICFMWGHITLLYSFLYGFTPRCENSVNFFSYVSFALLLQKLGWFEAFRFVTFLPKHFYTSSFKLDYLYLFKFRLFTSVIGLRNSFCKVEKVVAFITNDWRQLLIISDCPLIPSCQSTPVALSFPFFDPPTGANVSLNTTIRLQKTTTLNPGSLGNIITFCISRDTTYSLSVHSQFFSSWYLSLASVDLLIWSSKSTQSAQSTKVGFLYFPFSSGLLNSCLSNLWISSKCLSWRSHLLHSSSLSFTKLIYVFLFSYSNIRKKSLHFHIYYRSPWTLLIYYALEKYTTCSARDFVDSDGYLGCSIECGD